MEKHFLKIPYHVVTKIIGDYHVLDLSRTSRECEWLSKLYIDKTEDKPSEKVSKVQEEEEEGEENEGENINTSTKDKKKKKKKGLISSVLSTIFSKKKKSWDDLPHDFVSIYDAPPPEPILLRLNPRNFYGYFSRDRFRKPFLFFKNFLLLCGKEDRLQSIELRYENVLGAIDFDEELLDNCPRLRRIHNLSKVKEGYLKSLNSEVRKNIESLGITSTPLSNTLIDELNEFENVRTLNLACHSQYFMDYNRVSPQTFTSSFNFKKITNFELSCVYLTDLFVDMINDLENLMKLRITVLKSIMISKMMKLDRLRHFDCFLYCTSSQEPSSCELFLKSLNTCRNTFRSDLSHPLIFEVVGTFDTTCLLDIPSLQSLKYFSSQVGRERSASSKVTMSFLCLENLRKLVLQSVVVMDQRVEEIVGSMSDSLEELEIVKCVVPPNTPVLLTLKKLVHFKLVDVDCGIFPEITKYEMDTSDSKIEIIDNSEAESLPRSFLESIVLLPSLKRWNIDFTVFDENLRDVFEKNHRKIKLKEIQVKRHYRLNEDIVQFVEEKGCVVRKIKPW